MTLPAFETWEIRGVHGPAYRVGPRCAAPNCISLAEHAHHIVRRTSIGGAWDWIEIEGELVLANKTGLCPACHEKVTGPIGGHQAAIRWLDDRFVWCDLRERSSGEIEYLPVGPLVPQPPTPESLAAQSPDAAPEEESERCPSCGHLTRRRPASLTASPQGAGRRRKSWTVRVPDDEEDGAAVLDALFEDLAPLLDQTLDVGARYYVIVPALVYAQQNRKEFIASIAGVGG